MNFTDIFIKRPVLATVISLIILLTGIRSYFALAVREYPKVDVSVINIGVNYTGAPAELMEGFVATPLENAIAGVDGIDYITSSSTPSSTSINVYFKLGYDINAAFADITAKVSSARWMLPKEIDDPVIAKQDPNASPIVYLMVVSPPNIDPGATTDFLNRVIQPQIQTLDGVASAQIFGGVDYAMRIWLNPNLMSAHNITANDVQNTLNSNNVQSPTGTIKGSLQQFGVVAATDVNTAQQFDNLVIKNIGGHLTKISDVGYSQLGAKYSDFSVYADDLRTIVIGITPKSDANPLEVSQNVDKLLPQLANTLPAGIQIKKVWDAATSISASIFEVKKTIVEAALFVILVVFLFLGSVRILLIPAVTIPLSIIGVCTIMLAMGYSINTLTLMAMVLAIGMVVDDAIVVAENIHRHITAGKPPLEAALVGTREIFFAIISITLTLAAVYAPIGFLTGLTGTLFKEFAFTLASTVVLSGFIALTLSPMMCSKIMTVSALNGRFARKTHAFTEAMLYFYEKILNKVLHLKTLVISVMMLVLAACVFTYLALPSDLAPKEDEGGILAMVQAPAQSNITFTEKYTDQIKRVFHSVPEMEDYIILNGVSFGILKPNSAIAILKLEDWGKRKRDVNQIIQDITPKMWAIPGIFAMPFNPSSLPGSSSFFPIGFVVKTTASYNELNDVMQKIKARLRENSKINNVDVDLKIDQPQINVNINRNKAGILGISMSDISTTLSLALGQPKTGRFAIEGRSYDVIPQLQESYRDQPSILNNLYLSTTSGQLVPLSNVVDVTESTIPESLNHFQQLRGATLSASTLPGYSLGQALQYIQEVAKQVVPQNGKFSIDYTGESRQFIQESGAMTVTFVFALIFIFLILAAQFESFASPLVVMLTVPLSTFGALLALKISGGTLNIYSEIGLVTLIGLISKHGILMVEFANQLREHGKEAYEAIISAATIRLRPILMTTGAMILGALPLALAHGAGANSRNQIGIVIIGGMLIGTLFTLFVIPTMYLIFTGRKKSTTKA